MRKRTLVLGMLLPLGAVMAQGCPAVGMSLFSIGAGEVVGQGTTYTLNGIAYRTFVLPLGDVWEATLTVTERMDMTVKTDEPTAGGREIVALAGNRTVYIELERLTGRITRMRVTAKQGIFFRDAATATELIAQTVEVLKDLPPPSDASKEPRPLF